MNGEEIRGIISTGLTNVKYSKKKWMWYMLVSCLKNVIFNLIVNVKLFISIYKLCYKKQ